MNYTDSISLLEYTQHKQLFPKVVKQLQKDLDRANIALVLHSDIHANELSTLLQEKIYRLILEQFDAYLNLLYTIDVPEKVLKDIHKADAVEVAMKITYEILKREFQKVLTKSKYI